VTHAGLADHFEHDAVIAPDLHGEGEVRTHHRRAGRPVGIVRPEHPVTREFVDLLHHRTFGTESHGEPEKDLVIQRVGRQERIGNWLAAKVETLLYGTTADTAFGRHHCSPLTSQLTGRR
jgi:hypothetical protein